MARTGQDGSQELARNLPMVRFGSCEDEKVVVPGRESPFDGKKITERRFAVPLFHGPLGKLGPLNG